MKRLNALPSRLLIFGTTTGALLLSACSSATEASGGIDPALSSQIKTAYPAATNLLEQRGGYQDSSIQWTVGSKICTALLNPKDSRMATEPYCVPQFAVTTNTTHNLVSEVQASYPGATHIQTKQGGYKQSSLEWNAENLMCTALLTPHEDKIAVAPYCSEIA